MIYNIEDLKFKILSVGRFSHKNGKFHVKSRAYSALSIRTQGEGTFEIQGKRFISKPGDIIFIPRGTPYKVEYTGGESIAVHFSECNYTAVENISLEKPGGVSALFESLLKMYEEGCSINRAKAYIYEILDEVDNRKSFNNGEFLRFVEYVKDNFCDSELNVERICSVFFISKSTLQRRFNKYYDMSPKQYILVLRIQKAMKLLIEGELSVKEIAFSCGFRDEKYFSRVIKERYGRCPSEFVKGIKM